MPTSVTGCGSSAWPSTRRPLSIVPSGFPFRLTASVPVTVWVCSVEMSFSPWEGAERGGRRDEGRRAEGDVGPERAQSARVKHGECSGAGYGRHEEVA